MDKILDERRTGMDRRKKSRNYFGNKKGERRTTFMSKNCYCKKNGNE